MRDGDVLALETRQTDDRLADHLSLASISADAATGLADAVTASDADDGLPY